jgi:broad specificity phosphatase PhoE
MKLHVTVILIAQLVAARTLRDNFLAQSQIGIKNEDTARLAHSKIIHLVRHGQAYNNLGHYDWLDPNLTEKGLEQARDLGEHWLNSDLIEVVVSSPQIRALNTTLNVLDVISKRHISLPDFSRKPIIAFPELQELGASPSSRGHLRRDLEEIIGHPPLFPVDLDLLTPDWNSTEGYWDRNETASIVRAKKTRQWLFDREEHNIMVVGHDANLKLLVNSTCFRDHVQRCQGWHNAEVRHFSMEKSEDGEPRLIELSRKINELLDNGIRSELRSVE